MKVRLATGMIALLASGMSVQALDKPNILLIIADDLGLQLSCYGDTHIHTPHIDTLAASGTRFRTAYVTQSSCSPSRTSMFTGLYPHTHGHIGLAKPHNPPLREEYRTQTLPALIKAAGYRTAIIGKQHVNPKSAIPFDLKINAELGPAGAREVRAMAEAADKFITADSSRPFCLVMAYVDPHHPYPTQVNGLPEQATRPAEVPAWPFQQVEDKTLLGQAANYYSSVRRLDDGVGMLMDKLRASGKDRDTVIIFLGDNGPPFVRGKTTCYEAGLRTPFLLRWNGVTKPGLVSEAFVSSVDILPTVLDAVGLTVPPHVQGRSLRAVGAGDDPGWRATLAGEFHQHGGRPFFPIRTIRDSRYKVVHNLLAGKLKNNVGIDGDAAVEVVKAAAYRDTPLRKAMDLMADPPEWELYDLAADPWEFRNLSADAAHAATLRRMQGLLRDWRAETRDPFLDPDVLACKHAEVNGKAVSPAPAPDPERDEREG